MSTQVLSHYEIVSGMPEDTVVTFHGVTWDEYEELLERIGEAAGLRVSFDDGTLQVMTVSSEHEIYTRFIENMVNTIRLRLRINIKSVGSATMRKRRKKKGLEPDACFYIQTASVIGNRICLDFEKDPPPDVALEVDIHHETQFKDRIYAGLGISELWRYDGEYLRMSALRGSEYVDIARSAAVPVLTSEIMAAYLNRLPNEGELETILAFDGWLQTQS